MKCEVWDMEWSVRSVKCAACSVRCAESSVEWKREVCEVKCGV